jgi:hypothetical protein
MTMQLIERLTKRADLHGAGPDAKVCRDAAAEIERLRKERDAFQRGVIDAAAKIERLRDDLAASERLREHANRELAKDNALVERLRAALDHILVYDVSFKSECSARHRIDELQDIARKALALEQNVSGEVE